MKRAVLLLVVVLLIFCAGCRGGQDSFQSPGDFYYLLDEPTFGTQGQLYRVEVRETAPYGNDLSKILSDYLEGPVEDHSLSPFPAGTRLVDCSREDGALTLVLSEAFAQCTGVELILAGNCIAKTCFSLTDADSVSIQCSHQLRDFPSGILLFRGDLE